MINLLFSLHARLTWHIFYQTDWPYYIHYLQESPDCMQILPLRLIWLYIITYGNLTVYIYCQHEWPDKHITTYFLKNPIFNKQTVIFIPSSTMYNTSQLMNETKAFCAFSTIYSTETLNLSPTTAHAIAAMTKSNSEPDKLFSGVEVLCVCTTQRIKCAHQAERR